jgi:hypothetical protein
VNNAGRVMVYPLRSLGLSLRFPLLSWAAAFVVVAFYAATMARDMSLFDSPELALVAVQLGLGHAPGQPLHTMLGFVFAHLPGIAPLVGLNLLSAVAGAACVLPAISIAEGLHPARNKPWVVLAVLVLSSSHAALWEPATRIEVYPLACAFALWAMAHVGAALSSGAPSAGAFARGGVALGLSASANPYVAIFAAAALAPRVIALLAARRLPWRVVPYAVGGGVAGLLPYAYVFWVASRPDVLIWGAPIDAESRVRYFLGLDYARSRGIGAAEWASHVGDWLLFSFEAGIAPFILLGIAGHLMLGARRGIGALAAPLCLMFAVLLIASNTVFYTDVPDYAGYLLLPMWLIAAGIAALGQYAADSPRRSLAGVILVALAVVCMRAPPAPWERTRHRDRSSRVLARGALDEAPAGAFLIAETDHWVAPLMYLQYVEQRRSDVVVLAFGLTGSSWYWRELFRRHPGLAKPELRGPGGREGRIHRLLAANPERERRFQDLDVAQRLGQRACTDGWLASEPGCARGPGAPEPERALEAASRAIAGGEPSAVGALAAVALVRGLDLWTQGHHDRALRALLSGLPPRLRPQPGALPSAPDWSLAIGTQPVFAWSRGAAVGDPARNLYAAARLLLSAREPDAAARLMTLAAEDGLPEALALLHGAP